MHPLKSHEDLFGLAWFPGNTVDSVAKDKVLSTFFSAKISNFTESVNFPANGIFPNKDFGSTFLYFPCFKLQACEPTRQFEASCALKTPMFESSTFLD